VSYGITSRITKGAVNTLRQKGLKVGMLRPQTLWPFPSQAIQETVDRVRAYLCVELSLGQMLEDVQLAVEGRREVELYSRLGGVLPSENEIVNKILAMAEDHC
jgi:2-oxoglutarate ferredoxin oxidoreductase subunit alpha